MGENSSKMVGNGTCMVNLGRGEIVENFRQKWLVICFLIPKTRFARGLIRQTSMYYTYSQDDISQIISSVTYLPRTILTQVKLMRYILDLWTFHLNITNIDTDVGYIYFTA